MHNEPEQTATTPQLGRYRIDPDQSAVTFRTRHLFGLAPVHGTFAIKAGTVDVAEPLAASGINAEIETASFCTRSGQRDRSVLSPRFLDPGRYPMLTFRSGPLDAAIDTESQVVTGTLTVRDVTRPVRLSVARCAVSQQSFTARATARIDRTEFGITAARGLAGRYLDVTVEVQCVRN
jgi:polyisoprenoid-binding protein YceI